MTETHNQNQNDQENQEIRDRKTISRVDWMTVVRALDSLTVAEIDGHGPFRSYHSLLDWLTSVRSEVIGQLDVPVACLKDAIEASTNVIRIEPVNAPRSDVDHDLREIIKGVEIRCTDRIVELEKRFDALLESLDHIPAGTRKSLFDQENQP